MTSSASDSRDGQMMLYQLTVSDLSYFKSQQWSLVNQCFLLLAGLIGAKSLLGDHFSAWEVFALAALAASTVLAGLVLLAKLQESIVVRQARLDAARERLGLEFYTSWAAKAKTTEYLHAIWILRGALVTGGAVVVWLLLRGQF